MAASALESARRGAAWVGMMLARVFDEWEDRRAGVVAPWGKTAGLSGTSGTSHGLVGNVPTRQSSRPGLDGGFMLRLVVIPISNHGRVGE